METATSPAAGAPANARAEITWVEGAALSLDELVAYALGAAPGTMPSMHEEPT